MPFMTDEIWSNVVCSVRPDAPDSVHLADWPASDESLIDEDLRASMAATRRAVRLGLQAREQAKIKVRQPLASVVITGGDAETIVAHAAILAEELNVKSVEAGNEAPGEGWVVATEGMTSVALDTRLTPELASEGMARELVRAVQNLRKKSGLAVSDRILLGVDAPDEIWSALQPHIGWVAGEVLATDVQRGSIEAGGTTSVKLDGVSVPLSLKRA
jgi:isoleucyl-tRNA synthetase